MSQVRRSWTPQEDAILTRLYPDSPMSVLQQHLDRQPSAIYSRADKLGLRKTAEYLASPHASRLRRGDTVGKKTRFKPGHRTWNAGMKGYDAGGRSAETRFKPGRRPDQAHNYQPIGSLRITRDGLLERKVTDDQSIYPARRWVAEHRLVWEAANGPVPKGHLVIFKTGQRTTDADQITADKLECVSRAENMRRNSRHTNYPPELNRLIQLRAALQRQINKRENHE